MSYTNEVKDENGQVVMRVTVLCKSDPKGNYDKYHEAIEERIKEDGYIPKTSYDHLVSMVILYFDCDDNYGEYDEETGFGGYGNGFTLEKCFEYVMESGGWSEFDYEG